MATTKLYWRQVGSAPPLDELGHLHKSCQQASLRDGIDKTGVRFMRLEALLSS